MNRYIFRGWQLRPLLVGTNSTQFWHISAKFRRRLFQKPFPKSRTGFSDWRQVGFCAWGLNSTKLFSTRRHKNQLVWGLKSPFYFEDGFWKRRRKNLAEHIFFANFPLCSSTAPPGKKSGNEKILFVPWDKKNLFMPTFLTGGCSCT